MQKLKREIRLVNISLTAWIFVFNWLCISWQQTSSDQKSFQINKTLKMYWSFRILFSATFGSWLHRNLSISCSLTCTKWANYVWKCNNFCVDHFHFPASTSDPFSASFASHYKMWFRGKNCMLQRTLVWRWSFKLNWNES